MKKQAKYQENIFTNYISDKGLYISGEVTYILVLREIKITVRWDYKPIRMPKI